MNIVNIVRFAQFNAAQAGQTKRSRMAKAALQVSPLLFSIESICGKFLKEKISISAGGALAFDTVNLLINTFSSLVRLSSKKKDGLDLLTILRKESRMFKERKGKGGREPVRYFLVS